MMWKNRFSASNNLVASPLSQPPGKLLCANLEWWQLKSANSSGIGSSDSNVNTKKLVAIVCRTAHISCLQQIVIEEPQSLLWHLVTLAWWWQSSAMPLPAQQLWALDANNSLPKHLQHSASCRMQYRWPTIELHNCVSNHLTHLPSTSTLDKHVFEIFLHNNATDLRHTKYLLHVHKQKATITTTQLSCSIVL
jgi:hypothetical protein